MQCRCKECNVIARSETSLCRIFPNHLTFPHAAAKLDAEDSRFPISTIPDLNAASCPRAGLGVVGRGGTPVKRPVQPPSNDCPVFWAGFDRWQVAIQILNLAMGECVLERSRVARRGPGFRRFAMNHRPRFASMFICQQFFNPCCQ